MSPEAIVETISFGTPTGSARIACVAIAVPPEPPSARIPSSRPSSCSRSTASSAPIRHRLHGRAPVAVLGAGQRDVGLDERLLHARVDEQHVDAVLAQPVAQVRVLVALGVERAEEDDRGHYAASTRVTPR